MNKNLKCIKNNCPMYINDYFGCKLKLFKCNEECVVFTEIKHEMEKITCKISKLMTEYNTLSTLEDWIKDNQNKEE